MTLYSSVAKQSLCSSSLSKAGLVRLQSVSLMLGALAAFVERMITLASSVYLGFFGVDFVRLCPRLVSLNLFNQGDEDNISWNENTRTIDIHVASGRTQAPVVPITTTTDAAVAMAAATVA